MTLLSHYGGVAPAKHYWLYEGGHHVALMYGPGPETKFNQHIAAVHTSVSGIVPSHEKLRAELRKMAEALNQV